MSNILWIEHTKDAWGVVQPTVIALLCGAVVVEAHETETQDEARELAVHFLEFPLISECDVNKWLT